jgi:hypothetical protein
MGDKSNSETYYEDGWEPKGYERSIFDFANYYRSEEDPDSGVDDEDEDDNLLLLDGRPRGEEFGGVDALLSMMPTGRKSTTHASSFSSTNKNATHIKAATMDFHEFQMVNSLLFSKKRHEYPL